MSFAGGAQAENEPQGFRGQSGLVGVRDDGGIEEGCALDGVLREEAGPDQQAPLFGETLVGDVVVADLLEASA